MNINLKPKHMKKPKQMKNMLIKGLFALMLLTGTTAIAQNTTTAIAKQTEADYTAGAVETDVSIRVIDNKGTIKYLQVANGLTSLTNSSGTDVTTTTVQLGGTLTDDTYIDVDGNVFAFDGIDLIDTATESASTNAVSDDDAQGGGATGTGYTLLARDEATGEVKKLLLGDLDVVGGQEEFTATANQTAYTVTGAPTLTDYKTYVYRNGAKLLMGTDYTVATNVVTLTTTNHSVFAGDVIEVHYLN